MSSIIKKEGIPKLRFPEFDTLWKQISFNDIFDILQNNTYARADLNYKIENTKNIHYGDILVKFNEYVDIQNNNVPFINSEKNLSKFKSESYLRDGDIIVADTAEDETVGKVTEISNTNEQKVLSGLHTIPCRPKRKFAPMFLGFYMNSESFHKQLIPLITGIKVSSISKTSIATTTISVPLFEEQEKISKFMIAINNMIKEQESNISILETYNRGLISKIFKQEIRFKNDNGNEFPTWAETTLSQIAMIYDGTHQTPEYVENGIPFVSVENIKNLYNTQKYITDTAFQRDFKVYPEKNDILMTRIGDIGTASVVSRNDKMAYYVSLALLKLKQNVIPNFLVKYIASTKFQKELWKRTLHIAFPQKINKGEIGECIISLPCLEEQEKTANFLTSLDNVLQEEKNYLEYLKTIKKGLLQQMFV